jgi:sigma-B regulation protein RsbU (phosphoserine phosphatase)
MFTDGVNECFNANQEQFGLKRVKEIVRESQAASVGDLGANLVREVKRFIGAAEQNDDICLVGFSKS